MATKPLRKATTWAIWNGAFAIVLTAAMLLSDVRLLQWLVTGFVCLMLVFYAIVLVTGSESQHRRPAPWWLTFPVDMAFLGSLVWTGWYATAGLFMLSVAILEVIYWRDHLSAQKLRRQ